LTPTTTPPLELTQPLAFEDEEVWMSLSLTLPSALQRFL
jgi:hypothetical protein